MTEESMFYVSIKIPSYKKLCWYSEQCMTPYGPAVLTSFNILYAEAVTENVGKQIIALFAEQYIGASGLLVPCDSNAFIPENMRKVIGL